MLRRIVKASLVTFEEVVPALLLAAMVIVIVVDVIGRYLFSSPIRGAAELATAAFLWVIFLGGSAAVRRRLHVNIDVFVGRLPPRWQGAVFVMVHLYLAGAMLLITPLAWTYATRSNRLILLLNLPYRFVYLVIPLSFLLIALHSFAAAARAARGVARGEFDPPVADQDFGVAEDHRPLFDPPAATERPVAS